MGWPTCDLCRRTEPSGALLKCEGASVCAACARRFELPIDSHADPGSLGAVEVSTGEHATEAGPSAPPSDLAEFEPISRRPTLVIPTSTLAAIVSELDSQFANAKAPTPPSVPIPTKRPRLVLDSLPPPHHRSGWLRVVAASAGVTLAVMAAFVCMKAAPNSGPSVPGAMAREASNPPGVGALPASPPNGASSTKTTSQAAPPAAPTSQPGVAAPDGVPAKHEGKVQVPLVVRRKDAPKPAPRVASPSVVTQTVTQTPEPPPEVHAPAPAAPVSTLPDFGGRD